MTDKATARMRGQTAEAAVDAAKCARFGFCEQEAAAIFELRADGRLGYTSTVPAEDIEAVARAVKVCPARAIRMNRAGSQVYGPPPAPEPTEGRSGKGKEDLANVTGLRRRGGG